MNQTFRRQRALNISSSTDAPGCPPPGRRVHGLAEHSCQVRWGFLLAKCLIFFPQPPTLFLSSYNKSQEATIRCENSVMRNSSFMQFSQQLQMLAKCGLLYPIMVKFEKQSIKKINNNVEQNENQRLNRTMHAKHQHTARHASSCLLDCNRHCGQLRCSLASLSTLSLPW